ncbi:pentapeptide repeat-containing protein [Actinomadura sp. GTD37]|uniref:pentapeptide repeat-containing protein n=1 Tax=Actinomadura sp. GTD37 TaxID=1778030 RepID=UPI0035C1CAAC
MSDSETEGDGQEQGQDETAQAPPTRRSLRITLPTQDELDRLPAEVRLELRDRHRAERHQWLNSLGILFGVLFTAGSLVATGMAVRTSQEDLRNSQKNLKVAQESQLTDRYAKALEALADDDTTIRLGAIHAFTRLLTDSPRDRDAITALLAGFTREHDPAPTIKQAKLPIEPSTDIAAALTTLANNPYPVPPLDLHQIRTPHISLPKAHFSKANLNGADLHYADLIGTKLSGADLRVANLRYADLSGAKLSGADLRVANLRYADLSGAKLSGADLRVAKLSSADLSGADLRSADLSGAKLSSADLSGADLRGANLSGANLSGANLRGPDQRSPDLRGANLSGADLRYADLSQSADEIRRIAKTDIKTKF